MPKITLTLPDGSKKQFDIPVTALQVVESIGKRLASAAIVAEIDETLIDLSTPLVKDANFKVHTFDSEQGKTVFWHSCAHLLAQAVIRLYPKALLTIGPAIENGFYYDIARDPFHPDELPKIEEEMQKIVTENYSVNRLELSSAEAKKLFKGNKYKLEIIGSEAKDSKITAYQQGEFTDLCRGPHAPSTGILKAFKLTKISAAYWRGEQNNDKLQRIYGICFPEKKQLIKYLETQELAAKNDHRKLGQDLFWFHEWSPGSPFFLPKGTIVYNELQKFLRDEYVNRGYQEVITPQLFNKELWEQSGHWKHYKDNMFVLDVDGTQFSLKPMNCPSHILLFKSRARSYRDLPMRLADFCFLHRNELKGVLSGLTRVRKFSQDDAHIFCTQEQVEVELQALLDFTHFIYSVVFNFDFSAKLSTRPEKFMGEVTEWEFAEKALEHALQKNKIRYDSNPGDGAFYGPKIDIEAKDSLGRAHQLATIQLDIQMPKRMGVEYEGGDGKKHNAVMLHRAIVGSFERFIGILIEHYSAKLPLWLSPVQVKILTVADRFNDYAFKVGQKLKKQAIRVEIDDRSESISYKVRQAELEHVNYILVVGEKELSAHTITVRTRSNKILGEMNTDNLVKKLLMEIREKPSKEA